LQLVLRSASELSTNDQTGVLVLKGSDEDKTPF
jgi:hypothetical protein